MKEFFKKHYMLLAIILIAGIFRLWQIQTYPGGLFPDEAANGLDINSIFKGDVQPFYERGNGREALFFYFLAFSVALFGRGPWQHHIVSAGFGIAEVIAAYYLTKKLFGQRAAYLASFFMAVSSYATTLTRTAFRANTVPLFTTLTILFMIKMFTDQDEKSRIKSAIFAGLSFGFGFYTYISYRMMIPLIFGFIVLLMIAFRGRIKETYLQYFKPWIAMKISFLAAFAWIGYYFFISHPGSFVGRAGQVSIFSKELNNGDVVGTFIAIFKATILSFFTEGDLNWRHNVSGYPFLSPFISPFFALATIIFTWAIFRLLKQVWQKNVDKNTLYQAIVGCWFWFMLAPEVTTAEGIPHGLRLVGVIPAIFILSAWGVDWVWSKFMMITKLPITRIGIPAVFLSAIFIYNFFLYFGVAAGSAEYYYAFRSDLTPVSEYINSRNQKEKTYLSLDKFSVQTVDYLTTTKNQPYVLLVPEHTYQVTLMPQDQVVFTQSTLFDIKKFVEYHPSAKLVNETKNQFGGVIMRIYEQP